MRAPSSRGQQYAWLTDQGVMNHKDTKEWRHAINCLGRRNSFVSLWFITYHGVPHAVVGELSILSPFGEGRRPRPCKCPNSRPFRGERYGAESFATTWLDVLEDADHAPHGRGYTLTPLRGWATDPEGALTLRN